MIVELGGGTNPVAGADIVIDLHHPKRSPTQDAACTPWEVNETDVDAAALIPTHSTYAYLACDTVDRVYASHFLEHIPAGPARIAVLNEAWRVLKPGGRFDMVHPLIGYTDPATGAPMSDQIGWQPWADPTHVSFWWFPDSLHYFTGDKFACATYGLNVWAPLGPWNPDPWSLPHGGWFVRDGWEGVASLIKP